MDKKEFLKLVKKDKYQVFLFSSPCSVPINFISHCWLVVNNRGELHRYEVLYKRNLSENPVNSSYLYVDLFKDYPKRHFHLANGMNKYLCQQCLCGIVNY